MSDRKISEFSSITGAGVDVDNDYIEIVDSSAAVKDRNKRITPKELIANASTITQSGSTPTRGTVAAAINDLCFNVKNAPFNAKGDGSTDDTAAIQAAITAATAAGGGIVYVPAGTFITRQIALASKVKITGTGPASILKLKNTSPNYILANTNGAVYVDDVEISFLALDGNKANNTASGGVAGNGRRWNIHDCFIYDTANACINMGVGSNGGTDTPLAGGHQIHHNYCKNPSLSGGNWGAIAVTHGSNVIISNNIVEGTEGFMTYGIDIEPESGNTIDDILISGNVVKGGRIFVDGSLLSSPATNISVVNNRVDARGSYGETQVNSAPVYINKITGLQCTGNHLIGHADGVRGGIHIQGALTNFRISENLIEPSQPASGSGYGIHFNNAANCGVNGTVENNTLIAAETVNYGIYNFHATGLSGVKIGPNYFTGFTADYFIQSAVAVILPTNPNVSADNGDAAKTISHLSESTQIWDTVLTSARAVTLNRNVDDPQGLIGQKVRIVRTANATGAFNLNVGSGPLKALATAGTWCEVECRGATWILTANGSL